MVATANACIPGQPDAVPAFIFYISQGKLFIGRTGALFQDGVWAGHGAGRNNPAMQDAKGVGPLPVGLYSYGPAYHHPHLGPFAMPLTQLSGQTYGRSGFFIHAAAFVHPENSSDGCLIVGPYGRQQIDSYARGAGRVLEVRV